MKHFIFSFFNMKQLIKLSKKDLLSSYSTEQLHRLVDYFNLPSSLKSQTIDQLTTKLATLIISRYASLNTANMDPPPPGLPYGGNIQKAMAAGDRDAIRKIQEWRNSTTTQRSRQLATEQSSDVPQETEKCSNEIDFFTQESWSSDYLPTVQLTLTGGDKPVTYCFEKETLRKWFTDTNDHMMAVWVPNRLGGQIDKHGKGGGPSSKNIVYTMPLGSFVLNPEIMYDSDETEFVGIKVDTKLIGNIRGMHGISMLHGQEPKKDIYLVCEKDNVKNRLITFIKECVHLRRSITLKNYTDFVKSNERIPLDRKSYFEKLITSLYRDVIYASYINNFLENIPIEDLFLLYSIIIFTAPYPDWIYSNDGIRINPDILQHENDQSENMDVELNTTYDNREIIRAVMNSDGDLAEFSDLIEDLPIDDSALISIASINDFDIAREYLLSIIGYLVEQYDLDPSFDDSQCLIEASKNGYLQIVKYFVEHGADPSAQDSRALIEAINHEYPAVVNYLTAQLELRNAL